MSERNGTGSEEYRRLLRQREWQQKRLEIFTRDRWTCQMCGAGEGACLQVHHKRYFAGRKPWEIEDRYLVTLCDDCHLHETLKTKEPEGWLACCIPDLLDFIEEGWEEFYGEDELERMLLRLDTWLARGGRAERSIEMARLAWAAYRAKSPSEEVSRVLVAPEPDETPAFVFKESNNGTVWLVRQRRRWPRIGSYDDLPSLCSAIAA